MRILLINETCGIGSHGHICKDIADYYASKGHEIRIAYGRLKKVPDECKKYSIRIGRSLDVYVHAVYTRLTDKHGFASKKATKIFIKWAEEFNPDLVCLHNIHGYYINVEILFQWIRSRPDMEVKWTLHDCWPFTGHCVHYLVPQCNKWKKQCYRCPEKRQYPQSLFIDNSMENYRRKKNIFTGIKKLSIITPSKWLKEQVEQGFLKEYKIEVKNNEIDKSIFKPMPSSLRKKYSIENKFVILGVASRWTERKGLRDFELLSKMLDEDYKIVLIGVNKKQKRMLLKKDIIAIERTDSKRELAGWYNIADLFLNLTHEENFPTVNLEAEACGTPVITYDVGGCRETIRLNDSKCVSKKNIEEIYNLIKEYKKNYSGV